MDLVKDLLKRFRVAIKLEERSLAIPESFTDELNNLCHRFIILGTFLSYTWLYYVPIDIELHPETPEIIYLRLGLPIMGTLLMLTRLFDFLVKYSLTLSAIFIGYLEVATGAITALAEGDANYMGGYLFIITVLALIPLRKRDSYIILILSLSIFLIILTSKGIYLTDYARRYSLNDLISTSLVSAVFINILNSIRYTSWYRGRLSVQKQGIIEDQKIQLEEQIAMAGEIQNSLLPHDVPHMSEANVAYKYVPVMEVGGDFVDILYLKEKNQLALFVCDVSGHGVAAAFISSMVKMALNRWSETLMNPAETLRSIHSALKDKIRDNFVTACAYSIDLNTGECVVANAGHHALIFSSATEIKEVNAKGRLMTSYLDPYYEEYSFSLNKGDRITLYTDGITETHNNENKLLGDIALIELLDKYNDLSPDKICTRIIRDVHDHAGEIEIEDDMTIMIMEYLGA